MDGSNVLVLSTTGFVRILNVKTTEIQNVGGDQ